MHEKGKSDRLIRTMLIGAATVVILAAVKFASLLIVSFLLSLFIAVLLWPIFNFFIAYKTPKPLALLLVILIFSAIAMAFSLVVGSTFEHFSATIPLYFVKFTESLDMLGKSLSNVGLPFDKEGLVDYFDIKALFVYFTLFFKSIGKLFTVSFFIIITVAFMLYESEKFSQKCTLIFGKGVAEQLAHKVKHYIVLKSAFSLLTGLLVYVMLCFFDIDYAELWASLAFALNFIPNIGSTIAAIPAIILALVQFGFVDALIVSVLYIVINVGVSNVIEPRYMGNELGLSPLVVFLSLIIWGWLLGPLGMLLSIPIMISLKLAFEMHSETNAVAVLLGK